MVCSDRDPQWLDERKKYLTGSSVSSMLGVNPWMSEARYLASKDPERDEPPFFQSRPMLNGKMDEAYNTQKFAAIGGLRCRQTHLFVASTLFPGLASTLDALVMMPREGRTPETLDRLVSEPWPARLLLEMECALDDGLGRTGLLEMKQTERFGGRKGTRGLKLSEWLKASKPPRHYEVQLQTQLHVTGYDWGILCARVGAHDMKAFFVRRDDSAEFVGAIRGALDRCREVFLVPPLEAVGG